MYWTKERLNEVVSPSEEVLLYLESGRTVRGILSSIEDFYVVVSSNDEKGLLHHNILIEQIDFPTQVAKQIRLKKVRGKVNDNKSAN